MSAIGLDDKLYPAVKIAIVADLLREEGIPAAKALLSTGLSEGDLTSLGCRIAVSQDPFHGPRRQELHAR